MELRACYGMCGTEIGYGAMDYAVLRWGMLLPGDMHDSGRSHGLWYNPPYLPTPYPIPLRRTLSPYSLPYPPTPRTLVPRTLSPYARIHALPYPPTPHSISLRLHTLAPYLPTPHSDPYGCIRQQSMVLRECYGAFGTERGHGATERFVVRECMLLPGQGQGAREEGGPAAE
eukprot:2188950-Rhodomonas_salina.1